VNYLKLRFVRPRFNGNGSRMHGLYECKIIGRRGPGVWDTLGTTRGHATARAALEAAGKLADRRGIKIEDDPRGAKLRQVEFRDRYGADLFEGES